MNDFKVEWLLCVKVKEYLGSPCLNLSPVTVSSTQPFPQWVKSARASQIHLPFIHPQIYKSFCLSSVLLRAKKRVDLLIHLYRLLKVNCCRWNLSGHTLGSGLCVRCSFYFIYFWRSVVLDSSLILNWHWFTTLQMLFYRLI